MKRSTFAILTALTLTASGAMAQSTINTTAPGPTQQAEPGQTNNNLPNPGNPQTQLDQSRPVVDETNTTGTTGQSTTTTGTQTGQTGSTTTGSVSGTTGTMGGTASGSTGLNQTETEMETDVDVDVENDANTTSSTMDDQGNYSGSTTTDDQSYAGGESLPNTGSELPLVALIGLIALGAAFTVRTFVK
jgi:LPXTG-motif cell wall-anchored protein